MLKRLVLVFFCSIILPYFSIENQKVYDNKLKNFYDHNQFIDFISNDSTFLETKDYNQYLKHHNKLSLKKSWWVYVISVGSIGAGLEGIQHPERWEEGGENYNPGERNKPPGADNIVLGTLLSTGYFSYHQSKREQSLIKMLNEYNASKYLNSSIEVPYIKSNSKNRYDFRYQVGLFSEKTPYSLSSLSINFNVNDSFEIFAGLGTSFLIAGSISTGAKYYFNNKKISPYFVFSAYNSIYDYSAGNDDLTSGKYNQQGLNLSLGLTHNKRINLGIACYIERNNTYYTPILNIEIH